MPVAENNGDASLIINLIKDKWGAVQACNDASANLSDERIKQILSDIANDEINHIGMLQKALQIYSPNATSIQAGENEASQVLGEHHISSSKFNKYR